MAPLGEITALGRNGSNGACGDLERPAELRHTLRQLAPNVIANAAAYTDVDGAEGERERAERLRAWRAARDASAAEKALAGLERAAKGDENVMPHILASVEAHATVGEISDRLRGVFGLYQPPALF